MKNLKLYLLKDKSSLLKEVSLKDITVKNRNSLTYLQNEKINNRLNRILEELSPKPDTDKISVSKFLEKQISKCKTGSARYWIDLVP